MADVLDKVLIKKYKEPEIYWKIYCENPRQVRPSSHIKVAECFVDKRSVATIKYRFLKGRGRWSTWVWGKKLPPSGNKIIPNYSGNKAMINKLKSRAERVILGD